MRVALAMLFGSVKTTIEASGLPLRLSGTVAIMVGIKYQASD